MKRSLRTLTSCFSFRHRSAPETAKDPRPQPVRAAIGGLLLCRVGARHNVVSPRCHPILPDGELADDLAGYGRSFLAIPHAWSKQ